MFSYTVIYTEFKFPKDTMYPSIACKLDEDSCSYPLRGTSIITGMDYVVAKNLGCEFRIKDIYHIPFKWIKEVKGNKKVLKLRKAPFKDCIKEIQGLRRKYEKDSFENLMYKEIGNSLYGLVVRGINNKMKYDVRSGEMKRMEGNDLSNPIIASWITSFIRCVIGELLGKVDKLGGDVVSTTTDGFITDVEGLEEKVLKSTTGKSLMKEYRKIRLDLSGVESCLEVKNRDKDKKEGGVGIVC